jgi:hypothetical protein
VPERESALRNTVANDLDIESQLTIRESIVLLHLGLPKYDFFFHLVEDVGFLDFST